MARTYKVIEAANARHEHEWQVWAKLKSLQDAAIASKTLYGKGR